MNKNIFKEDTTKTTQLVNKIVQYKKIVIILNSILFCLLLGVFLTLVMFQELELYKSMASEDIKIMAFYILGFGNFCFACFSIEAILCMFFYGKVFIDNKDKVYLYGLIKDNENILELTKILYKNQKFLTNRQYNNIKAYYKQQKVENKIKKIDQCVFS